MKDSSSKSWIDLYRENPIKAWDALLQRHHQLIMAVIKKLVESHDDVMDLYTYTLENLKNDECKKLTTYFQQTRKCNFESWIAVVVRNCCMDWFRKEKGRKRLLKSIKVLPSIDQWIFRYIYWYGYSYIVTHELLKAQQGYDISFNEMCSHVDRINEILYQQTRWNIFRDRQTISPIVPLESVEGRIDKAKISDPAIHHSPSPERQIIRNDSQEQLRQVIHALSPEDQAILQLHFYGDLTLAEIASLLKMRNLKRVHRKLQKVLKLLKRKLEELGIDPGDFEIL